MMLMKYGMKQQRYKICLLLLVTTLNVWSVESVVETLGIDVKLPGSNDDKHRFYSLLVSQAYFGSLPNMLAKNNKAHSLTTPPDDNPLLCNNVTDNDGSLPLKGSVVIVPRGVCTFEQKAYAAQKLGAEVILIHGTLASRYSLNETKSINHTDYEYTVDDIIYPQQLNDYDCNKGRAMIPESAIQMQPLPYNAEHNDPILSGSTNDNLCKLHSDDKLQNCPSEACLLTGVKTDKPNTVEACCAWDLKIWLYSDPRFNPEEITIQAAYVTMEQGNRLLSDLKQNNQRVDLTLYSRYRPNYNFSSGLIWALGVAVAALAAYLSASDYRNLIEKTLYRQQQHNMNNGCAVVEFGSNSSSAGVVANAAAANNTRSTSINSSSEPQQQVRSRSQSPKGDRESYQVTQNGDNSNNEEDLEGTVLSEDGEEEEGSTNTTKSYDDSLELNAYHAFGFIIMASSGLLILFFFKIYNVVKVLYGFGCSKAVSQIVCDPICRIIAKVVRFRDYVVFHTKIEDIGNVTFIDIAAHVFGYTLGMIWLVMCFTMRHPDESTYFWVMQDVMGAAMCITFLETIKLNSIRVASILLIVAFFYDIFFVFVTPYLFKGESIMVTVATSGGPPKADPAFCEKYPDDSNCQGGDPLPMLLTIPRIGDYQGGSSLLGLGDIVLPGLLLSFAARYDAAKALLGVVSGGNGVMNSYGCPEQRYCWGCRFCSGGYFGPLVVAYAVGLLMANTAVYVMEMGQPALLYLVPCCLGTMVFMGWRRKELSALWDGPRVIRTADVMLFGRLPYDNHSSEASNNRTGSRNAAGVLPVPLEEGAGGGLDPVPSASDGTVDVPLLSGGGAP